MVAVTKMDMNNIAMVWSPNCLRAESNNPVILLENTRKEIAFFRELIENLDTSYIDSVLTRCPCCEWVKKFASLKRTEC